MSVRLEHAAIVVGEEFEDFTVSASSMCFLFRLPWGAYLFKSFQLDGTKIYEEAGSYSDCREAWKSVAGNDPPYWVDRRYV